MTFLSLKIFFSTDKILLNNNLKNKAKKKKVTKGKKKVNAKFQIPVKFVAFYFH